MKSDTPGPITFVQITGNVKRGGCYHISTLNLPPKSGKDEATRPTAEILRNAGTGALQIILNDHKGRPDSLYHAEIPTYRVGEGSCPFAATWVDGSIVCCVVANGRVVTVMLRLEKDATISKSIEVIRPVVTSSPAVLEIERAIKEGAMPARDNDPDAQGAWHVGGAPIATPTHARVSLTGGQVAGDEQTDTTGCSVAAVAASVASTARALSFAIPPRGLFAGRSSPLGAWPHQTQQPLHRHGGGWRHAAGWRRMQ